MKEESLEVPIGAIMNRSTNENDGTGGKTITEGSNKEQQPCNTDCCCDCYGCCELLYACGNMCECCIEICLCFTKII